MGRPGDKHIDKATFVSVWMDAYENRHTRHWVAERVKRTPKAVTDIAFRLRRDGVDLPILPVYYQKRKTVLMLNNIVKRRIRRHRDTQGDPGEPA